MSGQMERALAGVSHADRMDRMYRYQRHIYDITRKYYLLGRDRMIASLHVPQADGSLKEASDEITLTAEGAALLGTRHRVFFPADLGQGVIRLVLPDGRELSSRPMGLSYFDGRRNVLIAELKSSVRGQLLPSKRQVVYPDAFVN